MGVDVGDGDGGGGGGGGRGPVMEKQDGEGAGGCCVFSQSWRVQISCSTGGVDGGEVELGGLLFRGFTKQGEGVRVIART